MVATVAVMVAAVFAAAASEPAVRCFMVAGIGPARVFRGGGYRFAHRHHFHRRFVYGPSYYDYPYYYPYRRCHVVLTYYGPRRVCHYRHWRHHYWRHHHRRHHHYRVYW